MRPLSPEKVEARHPNMVKGQIWVGVGSKYLFVCEIHGEYLQWSQEETRKGCPKCNGKHKTIAEWVKIAEKLALNNRGVLPSFSWFRANGYAGLDTAIRRREPEAFLHIARKLRSPKKQVKTPSRKHTDLKGQLAIAEELANDHGGLLPNHAWLKKNGHRALLSSMQRSPNVYSHIERSYVRVEFSTLSLGPSVSHQTSPLGVIFPNPSFLLVDATVSNAQYSSHC